MATTTPVASFVADGTAAGDWTLDAAATTIEFHTTSIWGLVKVNGTFAAADGSGTVASDGAVTGEITVDAASVDTKNDKRDVHLRSADFLEVESFPTIAYALEGISPLDGDQAEVRGALTVHGVSQPVNFTATVAEATADAVTINAEFDVDRSRFGMNWGPMKMAKMNNRLVVTASFRRGA